MAEPIRLQKFFTDSGTLSRRAAEDAIAKGLVRVNGELAKLGDKVLPEVDVIEYNGKQIKPRNNCAHRYVMLNKPRGYVTTLQDEKGRKTVAELVANANTRLYPVGRLDMDSEGLLLLTDDGEFTNRLTHPRHEIPKIYHVAVSAVPTKEQLATLSSPMKIDGYTLLPVKIRKLAPDVLEMTLFEGRNRQIRKMCASVGLKVNSLQRVAIGKLRLGTLPLGKWRELTEEEVRYLSSPQVRQ
ncbi:MAG: rRNA pseudouridine synthase [Ruminococcaceae bacterium]|nr:rRNA pseudouridine synthase [Oscillospiraceae bacterium]